MGIRYNLLAAAASLGIALTAAMPAHADVRVGIGIHVAPPEARVIAVPPPRRGYIWAPGYWRWDGRHHVWVDGRWLRARSGRVWVADRWEPRGPDWVYVRGHWDRERHLH